MADPNFWDPPDKAREHLRRLANLKAPLERFNSLQKRLSDAKDYLELAELENEQGLLGEIRAEVKAIDQEVRAFELTLLLTGEHDASDCILSLHSGAGGTESQDWAQMLMRMYVRWAERRGFQVETLNLLEGDEAGIKSCDLSIKGQYAYGFLRAERGVHRLVRHSPFDSSGRRHTSFASVDVLPEVEESDIEISMDDLRIDTYRASGAGGQHVNKTESAIRITHIPTGIVVQCQSERSQHSNREAAFKILRARLMQKREEERAKEQAALRGEQGEIAWGNQIRSYVLDDARIKDHRTGYEVLGAHGIQDVLDGDLDGYIYAMLEAEAKRRKAAPPS